MLEDSKYLPLLIGLINGKDMSSGVDGKEKSVYLNIRH